ncbi:hypothetical protein CNMCM5793_006128 [Aspergillus hiratsukae]|uniref:Uncharacterized protein n=1 Tax=Aspergillus hiratsukae TaxID=1194566 RepID=A0A8H6P055_9EURO|nr:hypothetical protein CNMCM5793_006128 [Aspergillus hiratsukae]KAF7172604.1 hypothetical protein CNMCM6106_006769 [Aspergillus hiratsukae]
MAELDIHPPKFTRMTTYLDQNQSLLFSILPPELRRGIFAYALAAFEDTSRPYSKDTYWTRPGYDAPHRTYTEHSLTQQDRAPGQLLPTAFQKCLDLIHQTHGKIKAGRIRIFAQLLALEEGHRMKGLLDMKHFYPKFITLTIRIYFPGSVTRFSMDLESIERRRGEINYIANEAAEKWFFRRNDGRFLTADKADMSVSRWTGSSILNGQRWLRDEIRPGQLDYHVVTVVWRVSPGLAEAPLPTPYPKAAIPRDFQRPTPSFTLGASVAVLKLQQANIALNTPAEETWAALEAHQRVMQEAARERRRRR